MERSQCMMKVSWAGPGARNGTRHGKLWVLVHPVSVIILQTSKLNLGQLNALCLPHHLSEMQDSILKGLHCIQYNMQGETLCVC